MVALMSLMAARMLFETSAQKAADKERTEAASKTRVVERPIEAPSAQVLVAERDITTGAALQPQSFSWQKWPLESVKPFYYAKDPQGQLINPRNDPEKVMGMRAKVNMTKGLPVIPSMLADPSDRSLLSFALTTGMRAITIPLSPSSTAANILAPGDIVDVFAGDFQKNEGLQLEGVKILALDHQTDGKKNEALPLPTSSSSSSFGISALTLQAPRTVTLEVQPAWVMPLLVASQERGVTLVLRDIVHDHDHTLSQIKTFKAQKDTTTSPKEKAVSLPLPIIHQASTTYSSPGGLGKTGTLAVVRIQRGSSAQDIKFIDGQPIPSSQGGGGAGDSSPLTPYSSMGSPPPQNSPIVDRGMMNTAPPRPPLSRPGSQR